MIGIHYNPPKTPIEILFKDQSIIVVNKPPGLLSVPGKPPDHSDCVLSRLNERIIGTRVVHRLDMDTSGIMIFARTPSAQANLGKQFEERQIKKSYLAKVLGCVKLDNDVIRLPLIVDWPNRPKQKICYKTGRMAITKYRVLERNDENSLVHLSPITGRSHQLRIHMTSLGHPILGDTLYGHSSNRHKFKRLYLHSQKIELTHPQSLKRMIFNLKRMGVNLE